MNLEQINEEVEKLRNRERLWMAIAAFCFLVAARSLIDAKQENRRALSYREIAYELAFSFPSTPEGDEDTDAALQLLAQTDATD